MSYDDLLEFDEEHDESDGDARGRPSLNDLLNALTPPKRRKNKPGAGRPKGSTKAVKNVRKPRVYTVEQKKRKYECKKMIRKKRKAEEMSEGNVNSRSGPITVDYTAVTTPEKILYLKANYQL